MAGHAVYNSLSELQRARKKKYFADINHVIEILVSNDKVIGNIRNVSPALSKTGLSGLHHFQADEVKDIKWRAKFLLVYYLL